MLEGRVQGRGRVAKRPRVRSSLQSYIVKKYLLICSIPLVNISMHILPQRILCDAAASIPAFTDVTDASVDVEEDIFCCIFFGPG